MFLAKDKEVVQGFPAYTLDPAFGVGIHFGAARADTHDLHSLGLQRGVELGAEFAVEVADQVRRFEGLVGEVLTEVFGPFCDPGLGRVGSEPGDVNATGADMEKEEDKTIDEAAHGEDLLGEEIAAPQGGGVTLDELGPSALAALGSGLDAIGAEDIADGGLGDGRQAELVQFGVDAFSAPAGFAGHAEHELTKLVGGAGPASAAVVVGRNGRSQPALKRAIGNDRDNLLEGGAERLAEADEPLTFLGREDEAPRMSSAQDLQFDRLELNDACQLVMGGAGQKKEQGLPQRLHGRDLE